MLNSLIKALNLNKKYQSIYMKPILFALLSKISKVLFVEITGKCNYVFSVAVLVTVTVCKQWGYLALCGRWHAKRRVWYKFTFYD